MQWSVYAITSDQDAVKVGEGMTAAEAGVLADRLAEAGLARAVRLVHTGALTEPEPLEVLMALVAHREANPVAPDTIGLPVAEPT